MTRMLLQYFIQSMKGTAWKPPPEQTKRWWSSVFRSSDLNYAANKLLRTWFWAPKEMTPCVDRLQASFNRIFHLDPIV